MSKTAFYAIEAEYAPESKQELRRALHNYEIRGFTRDSNFTIYTPDDERYADVDRRFHDTPDIWEDPRADPRFHFNWPFFNLITNPDRLERLWVQRGVNSNPGDGDYWLVEFECTVDQDYYDAKDRLSEAGRDEYIEIVQEHRPPCRLVSMLRTIRDHNLTDIEQIVFPIRKTTQLIGIGIAPDTVHYSTYPVICDESSEMIDVTGKQGYYIEPKSDMYNLENIKLIETPLDSPEAEENIPWIATDTYDCPIWEVFG